MREHQTPDVVPDPDQSTPSTASTSAITTTAALALTACGGGGGTGSTQPPNGSGATPTTPPTAAPITRTDAARFLIQAAFAATESQISRVQTLGYSAWIDEQFALPRTQSHWDWMVAKGYQDMANVDNFAGVDNTLWRKFIASPDPLRQRMTLALSEIFVVSMLGLPVAWRGFMMSAYVDLLEENAFGTYRQLLQGVTLSPAMGTYLNMRGNQKADPATGRQPDENYAREVLQLLSIGLVELDLDGSPRGGVVRETYGPQTIAELARVFTGWDFDGFTRAGPEWARRPMVNLPLRHDTGAKSALGVDIPAGTPAAQSLNRVLDAIAAHPNVAPFISRQLIQRLVGSAPTPAYVARVARTFNDNGSGVRGDFKAVIKAILLDDEARRAPQTSDTTRGRIVEPVARFIQWARTFALASPNELWNIGNLSDPSTRLGQSPLRAPSVFNFFRPGYVPPSAEIGQRGLTVPELQITNESTVVGWINFAQTFVATGVGETRPNYDGEIALADNAAALVERVALLLGAGGLPEASRARITQAVASIAATTDVGKRNRVQAAVLLTLASPEVLVQI